MRRPKVAESNRIGNKGVRMVEEAITGELGWIFREQPTDDFGVDGHLELIEDGQATGQLIGVQIKAGKSFFREEKGDHFVFWGNIEHYNYWINHSLPVILVLCDIDSEVCYWVEINEENTEVLSDDRWKVRVFKNSVLGKKTRFELLEVAENITPHERKWNALALHKPFMEDIRRGREVIMEVEEWVNKSSGRGSIDITIYDLDGSVKENLSWGIMWGSLSYEEGLQKLFPWATISVDEDFYEDYELNDFLSENGFYDKETGEWLYDQEYFYEWKRELNPIRPYTNVAGEVDAYRLRIDLNELGKAFLTIDLFLRDHE